MNETVEVPDNNSEEAVEVPPCIYSEIAMEFPCYDSHSNEIVETFYEADIKHSDAIKRNNDHYDAINQWIIILTFVFSIYLIYRVMRNIIRRRKQIANKIEDAIISQAVSISLKKNSIKEKYRAKLEQAKQVKDEKEAA